MIIEKYSIVLRRLESIEDVELVRQWRNSFEVSQFMIFKDYITPEMQTNWFTKINNDKNYYFIIEVQGVKIGLTNIKDIDYETRQTEGGIFIAIPKYRKGFAGVQAVMAMFDFTFGDLGLKTILSHILPDNHKIIAFNKKLGFKLKNKLNNLYELHYSDYVIARAGFEKMLTKLSNPNTTPETKNAILSTHEDEN